MESTRYFGASINKALREKLETDKKVILLGQDIRDPFGGCFRITRGLSTDFPDRVINTPISEAAVLGVAIGLAMQGFKPVVEVMFYDFMTLCFDQLLNHAVKFHEHWQPINITIRTTIGKKDYGYQHTQDLDYVFRNVISICHPNLNDDVGGLLKEAIDMEKPVLFVEDSKYYLQKMEA